MGEEEGADDEEVEHLAVECFIVLLDGFLGLGRGGIGDDDIDGAEFVAGLFDESFDVRFPGDIGFDGDGGAAVCDDFIRDLLSLPDVVEGVDDDFCSGVGEALCDAGAEAFAAAGYEGDVVLERVRIHRIWGGYGGGVGSRSIKW